MRVFSLLILLFVATVGFGQGSVVQLIINVLDEETNKALAGCTIEVRQNGSLFETKTTATNGKAPLIDLPVGYTYEVYLKKDGYVTKMTQVDANHPTPEDLDPVIPQKMEISLFKKMEGIDFTFLETQPMAKFVISKNGPFMEMDVKYTNEMKVKIEKLKQQMEQKRIEDEKKAAEEKKRQEDYNAYMKAGDAAMTTQKYDIAITQYQSALTTIPNDLTATQKLEEAKKKKAELEEGAAKQKEFAAKMEQAKQAYTAKNLEQALALYKEANQLMPSDALSKQRITEIESEIAALKEKEAKYNKLIAEGQTAFDAKLYDDAIAKYNAALVEKPGDPVATQKLNEAKKAKADKDQAAALEKEKQAKYDGLIKEADLAFDTKNYDVAKAKYQEALTVKPNELHPTQRITEIDNIKKKMQEESDAAKKKEEDYKKFMAEGQTLMDQKNWDAAKQKYLEALKIKVDDPAALAKIDIINKELAKQADEQKKNEDYNKLMADAKVLYDQKKYSEAKQKYQEASNLKPTEAEPKNQIIAIDKLLADQEKSAQLEKDYQNFIKEGDNLTGIKDYVAAIDRYNKALAIKPGDPTATQKIADINKILDEEKKAAEKEKMFNDYMAKAGTAFNAQDYTNAKLNYQKAYEIKADPTITAKIKEIDDLIAKNQNEAQTQAKYDGLMKEADALYKAGKLQEALAKYEEASLVKSNEQAPKEKISEIKQKIDAQNNQAAQDKKFNDFVAAGDAAFNSGDYEKALANYKEALAVRPDPAVSQKIGQVNVKITEQNQLNATEAKYKEKIDQANAAFDAKNWEGARSLYREALSIKPNDTYATQRITEIEKNMQNETAQEVEANYQKVLAKADQLKNEGRYDEAISYYKNALGLKPTDPYPQKQIDEINKIKADKQKQEQDLAKLNAEYDQLIKDADIAYNTGNYTVALAKYKEALIKKPNEPHPQNRITDINAKITAQNQTNQVDTEYNNYISQADALFNQGKYLESISLYREALTVKPNDAYATNRIDEATKKEKEKSVGEEDAEYNKILAAGQKYFDQGDYLKALEYYKRALGIRPTDVVAQKKINEINQILDNKKTEDEFQKLLQQANTYFEKGDWKNAKIYYEKALAVKDDEYCKKQIEIINQKMKSETSATEEKEYQKVLAKADEYFNAKNYEKAKNLYERALTFKPGDQYPKDQLVEIDKALHPEKYKAESNPLPDYGKPVNSNESEISEQLLEADEQRQFMINQKVDQQRTSAEDKTASNTENQTDETYEAKTQVDTIQQDIEQQEWAAEVHRTEANLEVIEMQEQFAETEGTYTTNNENDVQNTNQNVNDLQLEIERRNEADDLPREEFLTDVEKIKIEKDDAESINSSTQTDVTLNNDQYVDDMKAEHITNDPNNDVARKNTEVFVEDYEITVQNKNNQDAWNQEDQNYIVKNETEVLVDEQIANNVENDIPRQESEVELTNYTLDYETVQSNNSNDQLDETMDAKDYTEEMTIEIEENKMDNDLPRQDTEDFVENAEIQVEENLSDMSTNQNYVVNQNDQEIEIIQIDIENNNAQADLPREEYETEVVDINEEIQNNKDNLTELNEDNSYKTVDQTEIIADVKQNNDIAADNKATQNSDNTNEAVEGIIEENKIVGDENQETMEETEDFVEELKHTEAEETTPMKNELGEKYPEGVTEEIYTVNDENGLMVKYIVRRIVVINGTGYNYEKVQTRYGGVSYTKDGQPISEFQWTDETQAASLTRN